ncbi:MAG: M20/M25/M40 family metallo-hydrolase [Caulobacter sp.]
MGRMIALATALAGALLLAWTGTRTPGPEPVGYMPAATAFQTDLAMVDIRRIARAPHPVGSPANASVRDYLTGRMTALGLSPVVQSGLATESRANGKDVWLIGGQVENIVGVLPGKDRAAPALALMAHYDSVPASPGAADDATGVAVILDVIRALKAGGTPERDVIVIMTDGEEAGLLGARLFFAEHPLRKRVGLLINLESRGGGGRANMFQTGPGNGALIPVFGKTAVSPISNSLAVFLYENMPNDTDFTVSRDAGVRGLNFAFIGRQFDYHSATSTPANLDRGSVRHMGEQTLAAAADLAFAEALPPAAPDAVYSQTFGDHILAYPAWGGWIALLIAAGLIALAGARGWRSDDFRPIDAARGAGAALFVLVAGALLLHLARRATGIDFGFLEQRPLLARWALWETTLAVLGVGLLLLAPNLLARERMRLWLAGAGLCGGLLCLAFAGWDPVGLGLGVATAALGYAAFGKPAALPGAWLGVLLTGLVAGVALQLFLPAVAFLVSWPLVLGGLGAAASLMGTRLDLSRTAGLVLLAALGGGWLAVFFHGVAQGLDLPDLLALFLWLGAFLVWPLAWPGGWPRLSLTPAVALLALGIVLVGVVRFTDPWSARHPRATVVLHVQDAVTGKAWRVATTRTLPAWSRAILTADGGAVTRRDMPPLGRGPVWVAPAKTVPAGTAPVSAAAANGVVTITLPPARVILLDVRASTPLTALVLDGKPVTLTTKPGQWTHLRLAGVPGGSQIVLTPGGPGATDIRYAVIDARWPAGARPLPPRPLDVMPFDLSDSAVVTGAISIPR